MEKVVALLAILLIFAAVSDGIKSSDIVSVRYAINVGSTAPGVGGTAPGVGTTNPPGIGTTNPPGGGGTGTFPAPGQAGFQGDANALPVQSPTLQGSVTLDRVRFNAPVYWDGQGGTLKLTNCVVEAGSSTAGAIIAASGGTIDIDRCTLRVTNSNSSGVIHGSAVKLIRNSDLSGGGDGINSAQPGSIIEGNHIHDLQQSADCASVHNDGVQIYGGQGNITIRNNRFDLPSTGCNGNAVVFTQGDGIGDITIEGNYLKGGQSTLKNQNGTMHVLRNTFVTNSNIIAPGGTCCTTNFYSVDGGVGQIGQWDGNVNDLGATIARPQ